MQNHALAFIDTETTGLSHSSEIIELAVIKVDPENFSILEEWSIKIKPKHIDRATPEALRVNGYNELDWKNGVDISTALKIFNEKVRDCVIVGHNVSWDLSWILHALEENNLSKTFYYQPLDTISIAYAKLSRDMADADVSFPGLDYLVNRFGLRWERRHSALSDAMACYQVFMKLMALK